MTQPTPKVEFLTAEERRAIDELIWELTKPHSAADIAQRLGLTRDRVNTIERAAIRKMRENARAEPTQPRRPAGLSEDTCRAIRASRLPQEVLAKRYGVSQATISRVRAEKDRP